MHFIEHFLYHKSLLSLCFFLWFVYDTFFQIKIILLARLFHLSSLLFVFCFMQIFKKTKFVILGLPALKNKLLQLIILSPLASFLRISSPLLVKFISNTSNISFTLSFNNTTLPDFSLFSIFSIILDFFSCSSCF